MQKQLFTFCKTQVNKKTRYVATTLLTPNWYFLNLRIVKKNIDVEQKTKLKVRKKNREKEREFERKKKRGNQQK